MISEKGVAIKFLVLVLVCVFVSGDAEVRCVKREREALLSFKNGLIDEYGILSSWRSNECCDWYGVECSNTTGHVTGLTLDGRYDGAVLGGKIGSSLLELKHLIFLDLSYIDFGGDRIPEFLGSMKQLQELFLTNSNFSGIIPPQLGNITNLRTLSLAYNYLKSENLDWLSRLRLLSELDLSFSLDLSDANLLQQVLNLRSQSPLGLLLASCNIGDIRPLSLPFINASSVYALDLSYNHLTSSVFEWLPNISTSLKRVSLSDNALGGKIPNVFDRWNLLEYLDLSNNTLEGEIPKYLRNLRYLQNLYLYRNKLSGNLDELFGNSSFSSLEILDLYLNQFNGPVSDFGESSALVYLHLGRNNLTGSLPLSLGKLSKLGSLDVSRNSLEGTVSESHLVNLHSLKILDLSSNSLTVQIDPDWNPPFQLDTINLSGCKMGLGFPKWIQTQKTLSLLDLSSCGVVELPEWLWSFSPSLKFLCVANNQISGEIPLLSSTSITNIDLSYNNLSGPIPLFHPNTSTFELSHNMFSGSISFLCEIPHNHLFFLDLSNNMLTGEIPNCWEKMPEIFFLNLAGNTFSGEIPHSLGSLHALSILQLRGNKLSGELPSTLRFCKGLKAIDVGGNELSGNIPAWLGYSTMSLLNFHGNRFSGSISPEICNLPGIHVLDFSRNNLSGEIPSCFNNIIALADETYIKHNIVGYKYSPRYGPTLSYFSYEKDYSQFSVFRWKGQEREYGKNIVLLRLIDFSSNTLTGKIPESFSSMKALNSLNLSRNSLTGNIITGIGEMENLDSLDLSENQFSGEIPTSLAKLYNLGVLDLSNNNLSGEIPTGTQLQSFNASAYAGNDGLCGPPLAFCPSTTNMGKHMNEKGSSLSFMQEVGISMVFGFIFGFWGSCWYFHTEEIMEICILQLLGSCRRLVLRQDYYICIQMETKLKYSVFVSGDAEVRCVEREREALLSFKNGLIDEYDILSSWQADDCCKWYGVECSNTTGHAHVTTLRLDAYDYYGVLQGKVGSSLLELHHLNYLDLSYNDFGGNPIPEFIGSMKQLQYLVLSYSNFYGTVPPQIGNLTNLRSLDLSFNYLRTRNLEWLSTLSLLSFLGLSRIDLTHTNWQQHILSLRSLHVLHLEYCNIADVKPFVNSSSASPSSLDLSYNYLTSSSFDWLSNISTSLVKLDMSNNVLGGPIPEELERFILIEHLELSNNTFEGEIPKFIFNMSHLRVLVLYNNYLRGRLGDLLGNVSAKGILESLEILDLGRNQLNGPVPDLRAFSALTKVSVGGNNFTGSMPLSIGQLSKLQVLDLSNNSLEGTVSESHFIKLDSLKILDLSMNSLVVHISPDWTPPFQLEAIYLAGCSMGSSFPKWIQTQRNLTALDLSGTGITDEAPRWLWSTSPLLKDLFLSHNQICGTIPNLSSTSIRVLDLSYNNISGPIPLFYANAVAIELSRNMFGSISSVCKIPYEKLQILDLSNNQLAGEVPNCWENMPNLGSLNLAYNSFSGNIPRSLGSLYHLVTLHLRGNNLSGELPSTLRFCQELQLIDVAENEFTGEIPAWIGEMYRIRFLNLGRNNLCGSIPLEICNLTDIQILDLSINNLSGKIPDCFNNFTALVQKKTTLYDPTIFGFAYIIHYTDDLPNMIFKRFYEYSSIKWKGQESEYRKNLVLLKLIDFSSNRLTGNIPQSFSSMKGLISLNLSRNSLTGNIIPNIGEMEMLECLDLSKNQLHGEIPTSLAQLQYLAVLDLSNNSFSGKIPTSTQLQSFNTSSYAGNDGLCGPPLASCPEDSLRPSTTNPGENMNEKGGSLSFMQEVGISMVFGFIFGFWGVVGSLILKKSWRIAYFNFCDAAGDWFYVRTAIFLSKWRRS